MVELRERLWETLRSQWEDLYRGTVPPFSPACDVKNQPLPQLSLPSLSNGEEQISMAKVITPCCFCYSVPKWLNHQFLPGKVPSSNLKSSVLLQSFAASLWRVGKPGYLHEKKQDMDIIHWERLSGRLWHSSLQTPYSFESMLLSLLTYNPRH